jgi:hypothetical protein
LNLDVIPEEKMKPTVQTLKKVSPKQPATFRGKSQPKGGRRNSGGVEEKKNQRNRGIKRR